MKHHHESADVLSTLGRGLWLVHGHISGRVDAETTYVIEPERVTGRVTDLCAALSDQ